jgi:hypothetical protein
MKKILILIGVVVITVWLFGFKKAGQDVSTDNDGGETSVNATDEVVDVVPGEIQKVDENNNTFVHRQYGFSLVYPASMTASNFREGDGEMILFQDSKNGDWFQIYITPWDEEADVSVERIKQDMPDLLIDSPQTVLLGPKQKEGIGPRALIFWSRDSGLGDTREVWFVQNGNLYHITTSKKLDTMLGKVLSTVVFN